MVGGVFGCFSGIDLFLGGVVMEFRARSIHRFLAAGVLLAIAFSPGRVAGQGSGPICRFGFTGTPLGGVTISASFYRSGYPASPQRCTIAVAVGDSENKMATAMRSKIKRLDPLVAPCTNSTLGTLDSNLLSRLVTENRLCV